MTEDERRRFESLETLRAAAYASFNDRRGHEWKLALSIWTAFAILLAGLVQPIEAGKTFPLKGPCAWVFFAVAGLAIVVLHAFWNHWASKANDIDNSIGRHFRDEMMNALSLRFGPDLVKRINKLPKTVGWYQISHLVQVCITALLAIGAVAIVYFRTS